MQYRFYRLLQKGRVICEETYAYTIYGVYAVHFIFNMSICFFPFFHIFAREKERLMWELLYFSLLTFCALLKKNTSRYVFVYHQ